MNVRQKIRQRVKKEAEKLFSNKYFLSQIREQRKLLGIPSGGFSGNKKAREWIKKHKVQFMGDVRLACVELSQQFHLSFNYSGLIEAYFFMGRKYEAYDHSPIWNTYSKGFENFDHDCAWEPDESYQCAVIKIFPGATKKDVETYLDKNFRSIKKYLSKFDNRVRATRDSGKLDRNREIMELHKRGLIRTSGIMPADEKLRLQIPERILHMSNDARKAVITRENNK